MLDSTKICSVILTKRATAGKFITNGHSISNCYFLFYYYSGNIQLQFSGKNLLSVGFPVMMMFIKYDDDNGNLKQTGCFDPADGSCYKQVRTYSLRSRSHLTRSHLTMATLFFCCQVRMASLVTMQPSSFCCQKWVKIYASLSSNANGPKGLFTLSINVTVNVKRCYVDWQMGMQPILSAIVPVKKIKGAARQSNVVTLGVKRP